MLQEENEVHGLNTPSYQQRQFEYVSVLENPTGTHASADQDTSPLPLIPQMPKPILPPQNRQGRGGAILLFTLVLAIMLAVGLFAGLEYAGNSTNKTASTSSSATSSKAVVTTPATSSSGSSIEAQQEAAIAKIKPAV